MSGSFKIKVNNAIEFNIKNKDTSLLDVTKTSDGKYHVLQNNKPYYAELINSNFNQKKYIVKVNNNNYNISISNPLDLLIKEMGFALGSAKKINSIKAPMPGLILDVQVKEGQNVKEDDTLLILEAMKMENVITSPRDGVIKSVDITKGGTVEKGHLLIEFE